MRLPVLISFLSMFLFGCASTNQERYFTTGAGLDLHTSQTAAATKDLQDYYRALCQQANPLGSVTAETYACGTISELVKTGFNDIDLRCDRYLAWIDQKRNEATTFKTGITATSTLVTGVVTGSTDTLRHVAQALGFASTIYDAYNNAILTGLESSTIKKLVYSRRTAYRQEFTKINYGSYSDATYALRGYLRICTPQTIVLSANEYVNAVATGGAIPDLNEAARIEAAMIRPFTPETVATVQPVRPSLGPCPNCSKVFAISGFRTEDIKTLQNRLCIGKMNNTSKVDGDPGAMTRAKLAAWDGVFGINRTDSKISTQNEWFRLNNTGCTDADVTAGYRNVFERKFLNNQATVTAMITAINTKLALTGNDMIDSSKALNNPAVRAGIALARSRLTFADPNIKDPQEYSSALQNALLEP